MAIKINGISADLLSKINGLVIASGVVSINLLLDDYPDASAAYSLRKLRSDYTGAAIRVRESGGDTEVDIGFTSDGDLDTTALLSHCGANDGFVTIWYDQSGNALDLLQTAVTNQPQIVSSGKVITKNSKPIIEFIDNTYLETTTNLAILYPNMAVAFVGARNSTNGIIGNSLASGFNYFSTTNADVTFRHGLLSATFAKATELQRLYQGIAYSVLGDTSNLYARFDGVSYAEQPFNGNWNRTLTIGDAPTNSNLDDGFGAEFVAWNINQDNSSVLGIESNQNSYYLTYPDTAVSGLLYDYPGASAAYSLRQLTIYQNGYKEKLIRVRRSSDGAETDVYSDSNYELSLNSLTSDGSTTFGDWIGSDDGFVTVWYDQSGNAYNVSQNTVSEQPQIVDQFGVIMVNGYPSIRFSTYSTKLLSAVPVSNYIDPDLFTNINVFTLDSVESNFSDTWLNDALWLDENKWVGVHFANSPNRVIAYNYDIDDDNVSKNINLQQPVFSFFQHKNNEISLIINDESEVKVSSNNTGELNARMQIGFSLTGFINEMIWTKNDESQNLNSIRTNINNHYNIYP